jgi:hypothetical protein
VCAIPSFSGFTEQMAEPLRSTDGRLTEEEGKDGPEFHSDQSSGVHVESKVEDDGNHSTLGQKLKGRFADAGDRMKGKESSEKEDPHPELGNLRPATGSDDSFGSNPQTEETKTSKSVIHEHPSLTTEVTVENESAPSMVQKLRKKISEAENHLKGKGTSEEEDPHPELAYTRPTPQETTPGFFSKLKSSFGGNKKDSAKGKDGSDVPSEVDGGTHPAAQEAQKGVDSNELGTGYEEGSDGSIP